jgi:hypothetical protein
MEVWPLFLTVRFVIRGFDAPGSFYRGRWDR